MKTKEKPILNKSDIIEMFDRSRLNLYELAKEAEQKQCDIRIYISSDGRVELNACEYTKSKMHKKTFYQDKDSIRYEECQYSYEE